MTAPYLSYPPFVFYLVLRSTSRVDLPFAEGVFPKKYKVGSSTLPGYSAFLSHEDMTDLYVPAKGKELHGFSTSVQSDKKLQAMAQVLDNFVPSDVGPADAPSFTYLHQATPFQSHFFKAENQEVFVYGIYTTQADVLVVTNMADYDKMAHMALPTSFLYRFRQGLRSCAFSLNTKRLVARWARWTHSPQSSLKTPAERFFVLDQSLFPYSQPYQRDDLESTLTTP